MAHHVTDRDTDAVAAHQVDEVVPVPAHVQRADRGPVAHGGPVVQRLPAGGQHGLLECQRDLAVPGVGSPQPFVDLLEFTGAGVQLGLQDPVPVGARAAAGPDQLGDLLDPVNEQLDLAVRAEDGGVAGAPVPLLPLSRPTGCLDVVPLKGHGVALPGLQHPAQGGGQIAHAGRRGVVRVVREDVEEIAAHDLLAAAPGHAQELRVDVRVHQVGRQQRDHAGQCLEHGCVVDGVGVAESVAHGCRLTAWIAPFSHGMHESDVSPEVPPGTARPR